MVKWWVRGVEGRAMCPKHTMVTQARERVATRCQLIRHGPPWRLPGGSLRVRSFFQFARVAPYKVIGGKSGMGGGGRTKERHQWNGCASASQQLFSPKCLGPAPFSCTACRHAALPNENEGTRCPTTLSGNNVYLLLVLNMGNISAVANRAAADIQHSEWRFPKNAVKRRSSCGGKRASVPDLWWFSNLAPNIAVKMKMHFKWSLTAHTSLLSVEFKTEQNHLF